MAWKFLQISKANERIEQLEAELAEAKKTKETDPKATESATKIEELSASIEALTDLVTGLQTTIEKLEGSFKVEIQRVDTVCADLKKTTTAEAIGSRIAAEITARQGQPPLNPGATSTQSGGGSDILKQYDAIQDPRERTVFYRKNKAAYDAAFAAANRR